MSIKSKIFEAIMNGKYLTDTDVAKMYNGKEPSWDYVEEIKARANRLKRDRDRFEDGEIIGVEKFRRKYIAETLSGHYLISKDYYMEIVENFKTE